jgi:hypothetical protein
MRKLIPNNRRRAARGSTIQGGTLTGKNVFSRCVISDVSITGARVHLLTLAPDPAPETVLLELPGGDVRAARLRWQSGSDAGFEFIESNEVP